jgi:predicted nucleic acid-binding Zn ribbon protein
MRKIGETSGGTVILEMNKADWTFLGRIAEVCTGSAPTTVVMELNKPDTSAEAFARPVATVAHPKPKAAPAPKAAHKVKACVVCGKEFAPKTSELCCSPECKLKREQEQKRAYAKKVYVPARQAKRQALGLTKDAKAERLAMLKQVATRMHLREPDPVEALVSKAGGNVDGD